MIGRSVRVGRFWGIDLKLDYSWFVVFGLVTWLLASRYFPGAHPGAESVLYWGVAVVTSGLFFASVVIHELAHSLVARATGTPVRDITLFVFGGAAGISAEPRRPKDELVMAVAGPAASLGLAALFGIVWAGSRGLPGPVHALAVWLAAINGSLALFNLIPGLPLDGGRVLRAVLWRISGRPHLATRIAARFGQLVAYGFVGGGFGLVLTGNWADGIWLVLIGGFLDSAASTTYQDTALQEILTGHAVGEVLITDCPHVPRQLALDVVVEQVAAPRGRTCFAVTDAGEVRGLLTLDQIQTMPRERWLTTRAGEVMTPLTDLPAAGPDDDLGVVVARMNALGLAQVPVLAEGRWLGLITEAGIAGLLQRQAVQSLETGETR